MKRILSCLLVLITSCHGSQNTRRIDICYHSKFSQEVQKISFQNIEEIRNLNGKFVEIEGILSYHFENVAIYPPKYTSESDSGLWLDLVLPPNVSGMDVEEKFSGSKLTVIGRVNLSDKGHLGAYLATLDSAFCIGK